jgi:hypothetical protein
VKFVRQGRRHRLAPGETASILRLRAAGALT